MCTCRLHFIPSSRIRDLGSWINSSCVGEEKEESVPMATDLLDSLSHQLSAIEQGIHGLNEHMAECHRVIGNLNQTQGVVYL